MQETAATEQRTSEVKRQLAERVAQIRKERGTRKRDEEAESAEAGVAPETPPSEIAPSSGKDARESKQTSSKEKQNSG